MEYVTFILLIFFLIFLLYLLSRLDRRTKNRWRKSAYELLAKENPGTEEIMKTIKYLRLYGGRIRRDKEFMQLIERLQSKLDGIEGEETQGEIEV